MATTIITKFGSGAPAASDVVRGELAVDTENGRLYTETSGGAVIEIGRNPSGNVDVTGTVTADGLTLNSEGDQISIPTSAGFSGIITTGDSISGNAFEFKNGNGIAIVSDTNDSASTGGVDATLIARGSSATKTALFDVNGDISFYEDTGTTAKLFWDASAESLGIGTSSPAYLLQLSATDDTDISIISGKDAGDFGSLIFGDTDYPAEGRITYQNSDNAMRFWANRSQAMMIDSNSKLLIGDSASHTSDLLQIETPASGGGHGIQIRRNDANGDQTIGTISFGNNTDTDLARISAKTDGDGNSGDSGALLFSTQVTSGALTERMRVDSSGNVGIGTTPSSPLHVNVGTNLNFEVENSSSTLRLSALNDARDTNIAMQFASSSFQFITGDVGIGTTSPSAKLDIFDSGAGNANSAAIELTNYDYGSGETSQSVSIEALVRNDGGGTSTTGKILFGKDSDYSSAANRDGNIQFYTNQSNSVTEAMRIDSSGNVGIGVSPGVALDINRATSTASYARVGNGGNVQTYMGVAGDNLPVLGSFTNHVLRMVVNASEVARFDTSGNLLVGQFTSTSPGAGNTTTGFSLKDDGQFFASSPSGDDHVFNINGTGNIISIRTSGTQVGTISVSASATAYNTSSDQRLKENIVDAPSASDDIDAIQVRSFDWKADGSHQKYGMVAQELVTVAPEAVSQPEDPEEMMGVDYSKLVPMMLKEIQQLRARVAQLEAK